MVVTVIRKLGSANRRWIENGHTVFPEFPITPFTGRRRPGSALLSHLRRHRADHDAGGPRADRSEGVPLLRRLLARLPRRPRLLATNHGTD